MLELAGTEGWTRAALDKAAANAGLSAGQVLLAYPNGVADLLDELSRRAAGAAAARLKRADVAAMKVREKVRAGVRAYLDALAPHRPAVKRATGTPANLLTGPKGLWAAADAIWTALGDTSTDSNWYTKRLILSGVIGSTLLCWIGPAGDSGDEAEVDAFLDRRIGDVMNFEKAKAKLREDMANWPNPLDIVLGPRR